MDTNDNEYAQIKFQEKGGNLKNFEIHDRKHLDCPEEIVGRHMDIKSTSYKEGLRRK